MASAIAVVVDTHGNRRERFAAALEAVGCIPTFASIAEVETEVIRRRPDVVIVAAAANPMTEIGCLRSLRVKFATPRFLFIATCSTEDLAIAALHAGAQRYLKEPWTSAMLQAAVADLLPAGATDAGGPGSRLRGGERLVGRSGALDRLRAQLARISLVGSNVLIAGETGTGKELVAELIHLNGPRAGKPFVAINTAAIPEALLENELFGHERGAFTGATTPQAGKLAEAHGGTVFLDEIGEVSPAVQAKLLRAIESRVFYPLGGARTVPLDARIVAATNTDLERAVAEGRFRKDLYYRLNVVRVELPPLRERPEDIPALVDHLLLQFSRELGRRVRGLSPRALQALCAHPWPGNVRELRNVIEALLVNLAPETTGVVDVPPEVMRRLSVAVGSPSSERERLLAALTTTNWNKTKAASQLHMSRMTLYRKMRHHSVAARP
jgi:DNA-binding NtrC family response regulator